MVKMRFIHSRREAPSASIPDSLHFTLFLARRWPNLLLAAGLVLSIASTIGWLLLVRGTESIVWSALIIVPVLFIGLIFGTLPGLTAGIALTLLAALYAQRWVVGVPFSWLAYGAAGVVIALIGGLMGHLSTLTHEYRVLLSEVQELRGIIPICSRCKKIRDDQGNWHSMEDYLLDHSSAAFSHGLCDDCLVELYPGFTGAPAPGGPQASNPRSSPQQP